MRSMNSKAVKLYDPDSSMDTHENYGWDAGNVVYPLSYEMREVLQSVDTVVLEYVVDNVELVSSTWLDLEGLL